MYRFLSWKVCFGNLERPDVAAWGLAFKPSTDNLRETPSRTLLTDDLATGVTATVGDPVAM